MSGAASGETTWTVARLLSWTQEYFQRQGLESGRLCAEILLAHAMQCERIRLYTRHEEQPPQDVRDRFRTLVRDAAAGKPIAYLTGEKEFFSLAFEVTPDVLIPRPETEILVERTISLARRTPDAVRSILDIGTGSGCIAISLAHELEETRVAAGDVSDAALVIAKRNAERHHVAERIDFRAGDLFTPWYDTNGDPLVFDVIVSNPPYIATVDAPVEDSVKDFEPHAALFAGTDGLDLIRRLLVKAPRHLTPGGHLLMEMAFDQADAVRQLVRAPYYKDVVTYRDAANHERVLHVQRTDDAPMT